VLSARFKILDALTKGSVTAAGIFLIACSPYGGEVLIKAIEESGFIRDAEAKRRERKKFAVYINRLKTDGLIEKDESMIEKAFKITEKGKLWLVKSRKYSACPSSEVQIISFDIPEKERGKRQWLRAALSHMSFTPIQQSVWIGKGLISKDFLEDIKTLKIYPYLEIFSVSKSGTLRKIIY